MRRWGLGVLIALSVGMVQLLAGCGAAGLTAAQVRYRATQICDRATGRSAVIRLPGTPSGGQRFLVQGIAMLANETRALRSLGDHGPVHVAVSAMAAELVALRSSSKGLRAGNDPVVVFKTLQQQLAGLEQRANTAWRTLRVPACVSR